MMDLKYSLNLKKFKIPVYSKYGGIEKINNKIYYLSGDLNFYQLKKNKDNKKYDFISLPIKKITNNKDKFLEKNNQILGKKAWKFFGAKDILIEKFKSYENKVLIISSLNYYEDEDCYDLSVFFTEIINENSFQISEWKKIFSS